MKRLLPMFPLATLLLLTMGVGPCDSKPLGSVQGCAYQGTQHPTGSTWPSTGSTCNDCTCTDSGPVCTNMACADGGLDASTDGGGMCFDNNGNLIVCPTGDGGRDASAFDAIATDGAGPDLPLTCVDATGALVACQTDAADSTCVYGGKSYPVGATFPADDGCNNCQCQQGGMVPCTLKACLIKDAGVDGAGGSGGAGGSSGTSPCAFDATYVYGWVGGQQSSTDLITLAPPASYAIVRTPVGGSMLMGDSGSCAPALPACGTGNGKTIDVPIILADIADPTVQLLLSLTAIQTITLGMRLTPDDSLFSFQKNGSAGFLVGSQCLTDAGNCTTVPDSVARLRSDLIALDKQQRMDPACAGALSTGD